MSDPARVKPVSATRYDDDYFAWTQEQAALLRGKKRISQIDTENIAEELEDLGRSQKREIRSRIVVILLHLLKWRYQPERRSESWTSSLIEQRTDIADEITDSPSLRTFPADILARAYSTARIRAAGETGLPLNAFPVTCPFTIAEVLSLDFVPEEPTA
jgi:hypothetical protein